MKRIFYFMGLLLVTLTVSHVYAAGNSIEFRLSCPRTMSLSTTATCKVYADITGTDVESIDYITIANKQPITVENHIVKDSNITAGSNVELGAITVKAAGSLGYGEVSLTADVQFKDGVPERINDVTTTQSIQVISTNNALKSISINGNELAGFDRNVTSYTINTKSSKITIDAKRASKYSTIAGTGEKKLSCGSNTQVITVKAQNGNVKNYTLTINRKCDNNFLKGINISSGTLSPQFAKNIYKYTVKVGKDIERISISGIKNLQTQTISGEVQNQEIKEGKNSFALVVYNNGDETKTYNIVVEKESTKSNEKIYLSSLSLSSGNITFEKDVYEYNTKVLYNVNKIEVLATTENNKHTVSIEGNENLQVGENTITITLKDENKNEQKYIVKVTRLKEGETLGDNANIKDITIKGYNLNFNYDKDSYKLVISDENKLDMTVVMDDENASYQVFGNSNLKDGSVIKIVTKSADESNTKTYNIEITKPSHTSRYVIGGVLVLLAAIVPILLYMRSKSNRSGFDINGNKPSNDDTNYSGRHVISTSPEEELAKTKLVLPKIETDKNEETAEERARNNNDDDSETVEETNRTDGIKSVRSFHCPSCKRELLGMPDVCPYCNIRIR